MQQDAVIPSQNIESLKDRINNRLSIYQTHARDAGFGLRFGSKTCFDHTSNELVIGIEQLLKLGIREIEDLDFAVLHEIKHYLDLRNEPEAYEKLIAKGDRADGLGQLYFSLYNCTEDITVNTRNAQDSDLYRKGLDFSDRVKNLYRHSLFKERNFNELEDLSNSPKAPFCMQYAHYILNMGMRCHNDITVAPEVKAIIERPIKAFGKDLSLFQFIEKYLRPAPSTETPTVGNSLAQRFSMVERLLEPRFEELLALDKQREGIDKLKNQADSFEFGAPKGSTIDDFKKATKRVLSDKAEAKKDAATRQKDKQKAQQRKAGEGAGLTDKQTDKFLKRMEKLEPVISQLAELWMSIPQIAETQIQKYEGSYRTGVRPSIPRILANFVQLDAGLTDLALMEKVITEYKQVTMPKRIRVRLVVDASDSMKGYMNKVADFAVALQTSFISANAQASIRDLDFKCEIQCVTYHASATERLKLTSNFDLTTVLDCYGKFFEYGDATSDHKALRLIRRGLNPVDQDDRTKGKVLDLVLLITDGVTSKPKSTKLQIKALEDQGLIVRTVAIGGVNQELINNIWNSDGLTRAKIIDQVRNLYPALCDLLKDEFEGLKIKIELAMHKAEQEWLNQRTALGMRVQGVDKF
jgi:hypothetical protein